ENVGIVAHRGRVWSARYAVPASGDRDMAHASTELLRTIAEVLDIRAVFPRVSEIVRQVVPHDALALQFADRAGQVTLEASSTDDVPGHGWCTSGADEECSILSDLRRMRSRGSASDTAAFDALIAAGYRSALIVRTVAQHQMMRLGFFSRGADAYTAHDVRTARQVAGYVAVAVAHEQLAAVERDRAEARGRSERVEARVRALA